MSSTIIPEEYINSEVIKRSILDQVKQNNGFAAVTENVGIGITPNNDFIKEFEISE